MNSDTKTYRDLLLKHGIAIPTQTTRDFVFSDLLKSKNRDVANAVRYGLFEIKGPRVCARCGKNALASSEATKCSYCPAVVRAGLMLILPPVPGVLKAVRDKLLKGKEKSIPFAIVLEELARRAGFEIGAEAMESAKWHTGEWWPKQDHPMEGFVHMIRSPLDPERETREKRKTKFGKGASSEWKKLKGIGSAEWRDKILKILSDRAPRTFDAIMLEVSDGTHTADVAHGKDPDKALWDLVAEKRVEHTAEAPILFRLR